MENIFNPIVEVLGKPSAAIGIVRRMMREDIYEEVMRAALDSRCMLGYFNLNDEGKKVKQKWHGLCLRKD